MQEWRFVTSGEMPSVWASNEAAERDELGSGFCHRSVFLYRFLLVASIYHRTADSDLGRSGKERIKKSPKDTTPPGFNPI